MLEGGVGGQNGVVWLNDGVRHRWCGVYREFELRLLAIVRRETLQHKSTETGASSTTKGVEDEEALETITVVCKAADLVHDGVDLLLADRVVSTGIYATL